MNVVTGSGELLDVGRIFGLEGLECARLERERRQSREFLIGTIDLTEKESSACKQIAYQISNGHKTALFEKVRFSETVLSRNASSRISLHERQAVRHQVREDVGVEHHDDADD